MLCQSEYGICLYKNEAEFFIKWKNTSHISEKNIIHYGPICSQCLEEKPNEVVIIEQREVREGDIPIREIIEIKTEKVVITQKWNEHKLMREE